jgi:hypothetical protein
MMRQKNSRLFTFVVEYQGSTLVEQVEGGTHSEAIQNWLDTTSAPVEFKDRSSCLLEGAALTGLQNAWCTAFSDDQEIFFLINIIDTAR